MTTLTRKYSNVIVCSMFCLAPAILVACQDVPVDSQTETASASLTESSGTPGESILASNDASHEWGRGHSGNERMAKLFERFDKDGDGKVALKDLPDRLRERLAKADTNNDGAVTRDELTQARERRKAEMNKKLDANNDGVVTDQERAAGRAKFWETRFPKFDKNGDGALTVDELPNRMWEHLRIADANGDGKITLVEINQAMSSGQLKPSHHKGHG